MYIWDASFEYLIGPITYIDEPLECYECAKNQQFVFHLAKYFDFCVNGWKSPLIVHDLTWSIIVPYLFLYLKLVLLKLQSYGL
jgi:hypothetical protein